MSWISGSVDSTFVVAMNLQYFESRSKNREKVKNRREVLIYNLNNTSPYFSLGARCAYQV